MKFRTADVRGARLVLHLKVQLDNALTYSVLCVLVSETTLCSLLVDGVFGALEYTDASPH